MDEASFLADAAKHDSSKTTNFGAAKKIGNYRGKLLDRCFTCRWMEIDF